MASVKSDHFFEYGSAGWEDAWGWLGKLMKGRVGDNHGRRAAYQALKSHCRKDNQAVPDATVKRLMRLVLEGLPVEVDLLVMDSEVLSGETWQYMGTFKDQVTGQWQHQFRHRHLDLTGGREVWNTPVGVPIPGDDGRKPSVELVHPVPDSGQPF